VGLLFAAVATGQTYPAVAGRPRHGVIVFIDGEHPELCDAQMVPATTTIARVGTRFAQAEVGSPSDSMPGILGLLTGPPTAVTGVPYDDDYDRNFGQAIELTDEVHVPARRAPNDLLRVPMLFKAAKALGLKRSFVAKHVGHEILRGPSGKRIDMLALPEMTT
jgi:hypothetical protein